MGADDMGAIESLRKYYSLSLSEIDIENLMGELAVETDRSSVVMLGSILEDHLTQAIRLRLRKMDEKEEKDLKTFH